MGAATLSDATSLQAIEQAASSGKLIVMHFWAAWCEPCKHMDVVMGQLAEDHLSATFLRVEAEVVDAASIKYEIASVPTFILLKGGKVVGKVEGADPAALTDLVVAQAGSGAAAAAGKQQNGAAAAATAESQEAVQGRIKYLLDQNPVVLFMKGTADTPKCGFSGRVVAALKELQVPFKSVDILEDEALRAGVKVYGDWPTYPQLYVKGELLGGCDIVTEMKATGDLERHLIDKLGPNFKQSSTTTSTPAPAAAPAAAPASAPKQAAAPVQEASTERLQALVNRAPVMLFMKGTPQAPRCGFSRKVAEALSSLSIPFGSFDILEDEAVRQGLKTFSQWPTYPQVYVKGELLGGCDIVLQMKESNELKKAVDEMLHRMDST